MLFRFRFQKKKEERKVNRVRFELLWVFHFLPQPPLSLSLSLILISQKCRLGEAYNYTALGCSLFLCPFLLMNSHAFAFDYAS